MRNYTLYAIRYTLILFLITSLLGCDAFVRKFTRKPKKDQTPKEEMVLAPQEYKPTMSKEEQYRQYFLFWKSWQDELITALTSRDPNHKKQVDCANEAIKNLVGMRLLLNSEGQKKLDIYISRMTELRDSVDNDAYSTNVSSNRLEAERIKRDILQYFSFGDIKKSLV
jgi:hypothetical protein